MSDTDRALLQEYRTTVLALQAHTLAIKALTEAIEQIANRRTHAEVASVILRWLSGTWTGRVIVGVAAIGTLTAWGIDPETIRSFVGALFGGAG